MRSEADFVTWLLRELDLRGWSYAELARRSKLHPSSIGNIIRRVRKPGGDVLLAIAKALEYSPGVVYQAAGLWPDDKQPDQIFDRVNYILERLPPEKRDEILAMAEFMYDREQGRKHDTRPRTAEG